MSINQAIGNALSGLALQSRAVEIVSRNVSNATTPDYTAKRLETSPRLVGDRGAGVQVDRVARAETPLTTAARRRAGGEAELSGSAAETARALFDLLGPQGPGGALTERFGAFESALRTLADAPESAVSREAAVATATELVHGFNAISEGARGLRQAQDAEIGRQVGALNESLAEIARLNREVQTARASGRDDTALADKRDARIDAVNVLVPVRATLQPSGVVELRSADGSLLVGAQARRLDFQPGGGFGESQTLGAGLSGLRLVGADGAPTGPELAPSAGGPQTLRGGALEAAFLARDRDIPAFTDELNALAEALADRFADIEGADASGGTGGLFVLNVGGEGAASRLRLHPDATAEAMRQGLDPAALPRAAGDATVPLSFYAAFMGRSEPPEKDLSALAANLVSGREAGAERAEAEASLRRGAELGLREAELSETAVDSDAELQRLLTIERAYAANARVLQAADEMLRRLTEL